MNVKNNSTEINGRENKGRTLKPLILLKPYLMRYWQVLTAALVALALAALAMLAIPLGVRRMIDHGFSSGNASFIDQYFAMMIVIGLLLAVASATRFYCVNWLGERVLSDLKNDVFRHLTSLSPAFYDEAHSGEVMSRLTADSTQIKTAVSAGASQALRNMVMIVGAVTMMFFTSFKLSILTIIAIPIIVLPLIAYGRLVRRLSRIAQDQFAEASAYAGENLSAIRTLQAFTNEPWVSAQYAQSVEHTFKASKARLRARATLTALAIFLVFATVVGVLWYGSLEVFSGTMSVGRLGQFVLYAILAAAAFGELSEIWGEVQQAAGAAERLFELLTLKSEVYSPLKPHPMPVPAVGEILFRNVSFCYPTRPDQRALKNVSLEIKQGERVAIVGPSGAGKSTLLHLSLRFFDATSGDVLVDGLKVQDVSLSELRQRIGYVPQEAALFADTVENNIRYGSAEASRSAVWAAAEAALADDFITELPQGYETRLGERGVTLSGGQRQRIAIARAILKDAPILLLDEATSALDSESEKWVQTALEHVMKNRTTLVIAHRLATVLHADQIIVIDQGEIVERGNHDTLMSKDGLYARLANLQFNGDCPPKS